MKTKSKLKVTEPLYKNLRQLPKIYISLTNKPLIKVCIHDHPDFTDTRTTYTIAEYGFYRSQDEYEGFDGNYYTFP